MAKKRYINTKFWSDDFIIGLKPLERYFFLYLLTNEHTEICGIYELSLGVIMRETDLNKEQIIDIFSVLKSKIVYVDGWVKINNFGKHQAVNPKIEIGIERSLKEIPDEIMAKFSNNNIDYDSLSKTTIETELLKLKPKLKPKLSLKREGRFAPPSLEDVKKYILDNNYNVDAENFINFYESKGWLVGKAKMKDWQAAVRTWNKRQDKDNSRNIIKL